MKIICIGHNYKEYIKELNNTLPKEPLFFLKPDSALLINNKPFFYPDFSNDIQHEVEVVIKINRLGKNILPQFAHRYFDEVGIGIDFTSRDLQNKCRENGLPWEISKAFDNSAPISKFILKSNLPSFNTIHFRLDVNGKTVQRGNTKDMIFTIEDIISYISKFFTLKIGDLIFTGTPAGVKSVKIGDHLEAFMEDIKMLDFCIK